MASRAATQSRRQPADWRAAFRASARRAAQLVGAGLLFFALAFLALALISYTQTDPSGSTAASGERIGNWMGSGGAWVSELALRLFGWTAVLLLPLLYAFARKLWMDRQG